MVISLEQGADLHMAQLMPLPVTISCFSKIQIGFNNSHDNVYGAVIMTKVIARVHLVHLMNVD